MTLQDLHIQRQYIITSIIEQAGRQNLQRVMKRMVALLPDYRDLCAFDTEPLILAAIRSCSLRHLQMPSKPIPFCDRRDLQHLKSLM